MGYMPELNAHRTHQHLPMPLPRWIDLQADAELQAGNVDRAERLSRQAAELRLTGGDRQDRSVPR